MRVFVFHLMPWPYLPADFGETHDSAWVVCENSLYDPVRGHEVYNRYLDTLELADTLGFDGVCVNEHHQNAYGLMPSPNLMAAALARRTRSAALVVLGNSLALYNPPIRVAEEFAMLDVMSGGRLVAGFPVGTSMDTNFAYGQVPAVLRDKYYEAHDLVIQAWTRPEPFAFNGKFTQLRYVNIWPRPVQKPHPPIWVPGGGSIETWDWVIEHNYMYAYLSYFGYKRGKTVMEGYWEAVDRHNVEPNPYRAGFLQLVAVSDTDAKAEAEYARHADYFYKFCLHVFDGFADAPGYRTLNTLKAGPPPQVGNAASRERQQLTWKEYLDNGYIIGGSPKTVRERLREAMAQMRVGHLMVLCQFGSMPPELTNQNTALFAAEVMPYIRDLWPEYEDHWWPKPLPVRAQP